MGRSLSWHVCTVGASHASYVSVVCTDCCGSRSDRAVCVHMYICTYVRMYIGTKCIGSLILVNQRWIAAYVRVYINYIVEAHCCIVVLVMGI